MNEALKKEYFPKQFTGVPKDGDKVTVGVAELTWHALGTEDKPLKGFTLSVSEAGK
jgi:hypothetical protein